MALYDENGKITIDENAAQYDIQNLNRSIGSLNEALSIVAAVEARASQFKGETADALQSAASSIARKLRAMIEDTEESARYIRATVNKYQRIDAALKDQINSTL